MAENANVKTGVGITETGYLDRKQLESMKATDLKKLAADMGVDIAGNAKKEDIINTLAAIKVDIDVEARQTDETATAVGTDNETIPETETVTMEAPAAEKSHRMYVGASVPGMKKNTVFTGEIPKILDVPFVRELCVDIENVNNFHKKMAVTSSREAFCYRKSVEYAQTLKK